MDFQRKNYSDQVLVNLYKSMLEEELFLDHMEDISPTSADDQSLIFGAIKRSVRALPADEEFFIAQLPNEEFVHDFGKELLYKAIRHNDELHELVVEKLKNWNEGRVAILDMLLLNAFHYRTPSTLAPSDHLLT